MVLIAGFLSGILASLLGVGGAVLTTPVIRFLGATPIAAVGSTVPAILPGAIAGALRYRKEGYLNERSAVICGFSGMAFAAVGAWVADVVDARWLMILTALLVTWSGLQLARSAFLSSHAEAAEDLAANGQEVVEAAEGRARGGHSSELDEDPSVPRLVILGVSAGFLAGLLGVGGGILLTPGLTMFVKLAPKKAIATSLAAVAMMSSTALVTHIALGHVDWTFALPLALGIVPGARVGARITIASSDRQVRLTAGLAFLVIGCGYLLREVASL